MNQPKPIITIAIPTFNRQEVLLDTLGWLVKQDGFYDEDIEIIISDNHSAVNPEFLIIEFQKNHNKEIIFHRNERNEGIDGNIHRVSELANGDYILFMSDDDILLPGTLRYLISLVKTTSDLLFCFVNGTPFTGNYLPNNQNSPIIKIDKTIKTRSANELIESIWIWSTFLSSFFVERRAWIGVENRAQFIGTDIYLTNVLFHLLAKNPDMTKIVLAESMVAARMEYTGSFRIMFAFGLNFMKLICEDAPRLGFSKKSLRRIKVRSIRNGLPPMVMMIRCGQNPRYMTLDEIRMLFKYLWWEPIAWIYLLPTTILPTAMLNGLRRLVHFVRAMRKKFSV